MFSGFAEETVQFFLDLRFHNYSDYFHANHDRYTETVQRPFYDLIEELAPVMREIDPSMEVRPHKCLSRIHRDTRFSRDKSPYRDHLWFLFRRAAEPREKSLFFYGEFGPDRLNWGLGFWGENREAMDIFRKKLTADPEKIREVIRRLQLPERDLGIGGSVFRKLPVPENIPAELVRWYLAREIYIGKLHPDYHWAFTPRLQEEMQEDFRALAPLYHLFRGICDENTYE